MSDNNSAAYVRSSFVKYFEEKGHKFWASSPVLPHNDPSLLFINAGMNQFKPKILNCLEHGSPLIEIDRAVNYQKCIRAGGKHNDLDDVGYDVYHHTFFEMLGNWSFGDYFKKEAIDMAWDLLINVWKLPKDRIYVTYFGGDPSLIDVEADYEAKQIWAQYLPLERILPFGAKDNFWEMGESGPCGPCSEIHYDRIGNRDAKHLLNKNDCNVVEIWNLVFMQFNRSADKKLHKLNKLCVDTGMGLERIVSIIQNKSSNYDTDLFIPIISKINDLVIGLRPYQGLVGKDDIDNIDTAYRVISDHIRTLVVGIADGIYPSNEGRGHVLRRIIRRAARYGRQIMNATCASWLYKLVDSVGTILGHEYPEIQSHMCEIKNVIQSEEELFSLTLDKGVFLFNKTAEKILCKNDGKLTILPGTVAFQLYSTYGFPLDLTELMAKEMGMTVNLEEFELASKTHRTVSENNKFKDKEFSIPPERLEELSGIEVTDDIFKYQWEPAKNSGVRIQAEIKAIWFEGCFHKKLAVSGTIGVILDKTSFYAECGGQVADTGSIYIIEDNKRINVENVKKIGSYVVHICQLNIPIQTGMSVLCEVNYERRSHIAKNHTAVHLLNYALRKVLGSHCDQRGSIVEPNRARLDFTASKPLEENEIEQIYACVTSFIQNDSPVYMTTVNLDSANKIEGLRALFTEFYPQTVRFVSVAAPFEAFEEQKTDGFTTSAELCGGTHVNSCGILDDFIMYYEEGISKGVRRIALTTGLEALRSKLFTKKLLDKLLHFEKHGIHENIEEWERVRDKIKNGKESIPILEKRKLQSLVETIIKKNVAAEKNEAKELKFLANKIGKDWQNSDFLASAIVANELKGNFKAMKSLISTIYKNNSKNPKILVIISEMKSETALLCDSRSEIWNASDLVAQIISKSSCGSGSGSKVCAQARFPANNSELLAKLTNEILKNI